MTTDYADLEKRLRAYDSCNRHNHDHYCPNCDRDIRGDLFTDAASAISALVRERDSARAFLDRIASAEAHLKHYAYGRTTDEQIGEVARNVMRDYRKHSGLSSPGDAEDR